MTEIHVHAADATREQAVPPVVIHIDRPQPREQGDGWMNEARARHRHDAKMLANALWAGLPGGTLDELVAEMLARRATLFRVPMLAPPTDDDAAGGAR
jgi:hypothetical protein